MGCDGFNPKVLLELTTETAGAVVKFLEKGGTKWEMTATSLHSNVLLDIEERYE